MKVETLKTQQGYDSVNARVLGVQSFGERNDIPQRIMEIVAASVTGSSCLDTYKKFIKGRGFNNEKFRKAVINSKGDTVAKLQGQVSDDYGEFGGLAIHVNYNALFEISSLCHMPFEHVRFECLDDNYKFFRVAVHPDWGKRHTKLKRFRKEDIEYFHLFNPDPKVILDEVQEAGGWSNYKGQIFYFSNAGDLVYPMPTYAAALTDMSIEEGLSNITHRNVRHSFLPAGMFIDRNNKANSDDQVNETKQEITEFQGDMNAGKLLYINLEPGELEPEFKPLDTNNTDKDFEKAENKTPDIIGSAFCQPPILRAKDVGGNFGSDLMTNAYDFYNSQTETERNTIEEIFEKIFSLWHDKTINIDKDYSIKPKVYRVNQTLAEKLGYNTDKVIEIVFDKTKSEKAKRCALKVIYGLDDEDVNELMEGVKDAY